MVRKTAIVRDGTLHLGDGSRTIPIDSTDWAEWLDAPTTSSFRFEHGLTAFWLHHAADLARGGALPDEETSDDQ